MKTPKPTNLVELASFLAGWHFVRESCSDPRVPAAGLMEFLRKGDGGLWFALENGEERYLPIDCGMTSAETGVTFRPDGFDMTKFGVTIAYDYVLELQPPSPGQDRIGDDRERDERRYDRNSTLPGPGRE